MKITKQQLKQIIMEVIANEEKDDELKSGLKSAMSMGGMSDPNYLLDIIATRHPAEVRKIKERGLTDRYLAAAKAAQKKEGKLLPPGQYLRQPDKLDAYLGLSSAPKPKQASKPSGGKAKVKQQVYKTFEDLQDLEPKFKKNPEIRQKYLAAVDAVEALVDAMRR